ncbi:Protein fam72a [Linnemannia zychae]|nr:Protein fam72a [Linnemannia zychae]
MPHSIRDFYLNNNLASGNYSSSNNTYNTISSSSAFGVNSLGNSTTANSSSTRNNESSAAASINNNNSPPRGYSSSFNTTYNINPSTLPSYSYTNRFLQQRPSHSTTSAAVASNSSASGSAPTRMPQYPPPQYQYYGNNNTAPSSSYTPGGGYSSTYYGGGNSDRYNSSYSSHSINSGNGAPSGTQSKTVCRMDCRYCSAVVCLRGMKAMLLADTSVELYSTDHPPGSVQLIDKDYTTSNCKCKIRDVACKVCGNVIGYHITQPCQQCLKAPNNGHFWMFHTEGVVGQERMNMDLGKLVQELVRFPQSATAGNGSVGGAARRTTVAGHGQREPLGVPPGGTRNMSATTGLALPPTRPITLTTAAATAVTGGNVRNNASTTRVTSISRLQRQQQRFNQAATAATTTYSPPSYPPPPPRVISSSPTPTTPTPTTPTPTRTATESSSSRASPTSTFSNTNTTITTATNQHHRTAPEPPMGLSATAALMTLTLSQFLQPMKWEQLPHPDLDIDLDPNTMGGEPLFAGDWVELVRRTAETAAANMSLALDQEEETELYMAQMMEEHRQRQVQQEMAERAELEDTEGSSGSEAEEDVIELLPDHDDIAATNANANANMTDTEVDLEAGVTEEGMNRLIHQVDNVALTSSSPPTHTLLDEHKDEDEEVDMNGEPTGRGRTLERRQHDSLPADANGVLAPRQQPTTTTATTILTGPATESNRQHRRGNSLGSTLSGIVPGAPPLHDHPYPPPSQQQRHRRRNSSSDSSSASSDRTAYFSTENYPAMALTSAMIAKASASAAAADAATAANNLLFGRRARRDYDMMCR